MLFAVCKKTKPELKPIGIVSQDTFVGFGNKLRGKPVKW